MTWLRLVYGVTVFVALMLAGGASAQASASHQIGISIPSLLRLRIDQHVTSDHASVPVHVCVEGSLREIEPASTRVEVLANTDWQLSVRFAPDRDGAGIELRWQTGGSSGALLDRPSRIASGRATGGWRAIEVGYAVGSAPFDGEYRGVIAYTLARP